MTQAQAYVAGWEACMAGVDGRYHDPDASEEVNYAWYAGFLDAIETEDDEEPEPACAGFGE